MEEALKEYRKSLEAFYLDRVDIYTIEMVKDEETKVDKPTRVEIISNEPCKLSTRESPIPTEDGLHYEMERKDKIFISPDININSGAKVKITKATGQVFEYEALGDVRPYPTHNEYSLLGMKVIL